MGYTTVQYMQARIPNLADLLPTLQPDLACVAAKALYWDRLFPTVPPTDFDDATLSERQKVMCGLRAALSTIMTALRVDQAKVTMSKGGPAEAKFEDRFKTYKLLVDTWQAELTQLENSEGIFFELLPTVPAFLKNIESLTNWGEGATSVADLQRGLIYTENSNA